MRFKLFFDLENENMCVQYRKNLLSYIKKSLEEYSEEEYKRFYNQKDPIMKPYCFSVFFKDCKFEGENIVVHSKTMEVNFSTSDYSAGIALYNAFNFQKNKKFSLYQNSMTLKNIILLPEKQIKEGQVMIKFLSPLVVRNRENQKDYYYSYEHDKFLDTLKLNIKIQLQISDLAEDVIENLKLEPIKAKKTIVKFYEKKMETSVGTFYLSGNPVLLNYLYKTGMRKSTWCWIWDV